MALQYAANCGSTKRNKHQWQDEIFGASKMELNYTWWTIEIKPVQNGGFKKKFSWN